MPTKPRIPLRLHYHGPIGNSLGLMVQVELILRRYHRDDEVHEMLDRCWHADSRAALVDILLEYVDSPKEER